MAAESSGIRPQPKDEGRGGASTSAASCVDPGQPVSRVLSSAAGSLQRGLLPADGHLGDHLSGTPPLGGSLAAYPGLNGAGRSTPKGSPLLGLAPGGGCLAAALLTTPVVSYTTLSPLPENRAVTWSCLRSRRRSRSSGGRFLWPCPQVSPTGGYPAPCPMERGLSSSDWVARDRPAGPVQLHHKLPPLGRQRRLLESDNSLTFLQWSWGMLLAMRLVWSCAPLGRPL